MSSFYNWDLFHVYQGSFPYIFTITGMKNMVCLFIGVFNAIKARGL